LLWRGNRKAQALSVLFVGHIPLDILIRQQIFTLLFYWITIFLSKHGLGSAVVGYTAL